MVFEPGACHTYWISYSTEYTTTLLYYTLLNHGIKARRRVLTDDAQIQHITLC